MMLIMFKDIPVNAVVDTGEYTYDNYTVEYTVSNDREKIFPPLKISN